MAGPIEVDTSLFLVDNNTGAVQTNQTYHEFSDGFFTLTIMAANSPDLRKADFATLKIFVLQVLILNWQPIHVVFILLPVHTKILKIKEKTPGQE